MAHNRTKWYNANHKGYLVSFRGFLDVVFYYWSSSGCAWNRISFSRLELNTYPCWWWACAAASCGSPDGPPPVSRQHQPSRFVSVTRTTQQWMESCPSYSHNPPRSYCVEHFPSPRMAPLLGIRWCAVIVVFSAQQVEGKSAHYSPLVMGINEIQ